MLDVFSDAQPTLYQSSMLVILLMAVQIEKEPEKMDAEAVRHTLKSLVDTRPSLCRDHAYEFTHLDDTDMTTSIIMSYYNTEFYNVKLALTAIVEHTPYDLYSQIVVLDDGSTDDHVQHAAIAFLRDPKFNKVLLTYYVFVITCVPAMLRAGVVLAAFGSLCVVCVSVCLSVCIKS